MDKFTLCSLFAGVGGIDLGFENTNKFKTIYANEMDKFASQTYRLNFLDSYLNDLPIEKVDKNSIPKADILTSGFPCQAFSIAGYRKGFEDDRGHLFFETMEVAKYINPKVIFLENVKNLYSHNKGNTFKIVIDTLKNNGYYTKYKILNSKDYANIPQNRDRIYIVGLKDKEAYQNFEFPKPQELNIPLCNFIDFTSRDIDEYYFYRNNKNSFYAQLEESIVSQETVYQWRRKYVRANQNGLCPTLTANMGTGGHNVPLIKTDTGIRKLTERECFNLQGFPNSFKLPNIAKSHLYKQAGNSVVVTLITHIAKNIAKALDIS